MLDSTPVYQGPLLRVYRWDEPLANGSSAIFERCVRPDSTSVLAFLDPETILFVREKQLGRKDVFLDLPGGRVDAGETHEQAARRELVEETGYTAGGIQLWNEETCAGLVSFQTSLFVAKNLERLTTKALTHDLTEQIELVPISLKEAGAFCLKQNLRRTQATLALLRLAYDKEAQERLTTFLHT